MTFDTRSPDGRSERQIVLDLVRGLEMKPGDVVTYDQLHEALGRGEEERHAVCQAARDASDRLLIEDQRVLVAESRKGYRMAKANEHVRLADSRRKRAGRQLVRGARTVEYVNDAELTESERSTSVKMSIAMRQMASAVAHVQRRQDQQDKALRAIDSRLGVVERKAGIRKPETIDHETRETVDGPDFQSDEDRFGKAG